MRLGLCCCAGNPLTPETFCPPNLPSGFGTRNYRIAFPTIYPLSLGRENPPYAGMPNDQGRCPSTASSPAWSVPVCDYYNELYLYDTLASACSGSNVPYCTEAYGPSGFSAAAANWDFTGAQASAGIGQIQKAWSTSTSLVAAYLQRCWFVGLPNGGDANRTRLRVTVDFDYTVNRAICVGGTPRARKASSTYEAIYIGDPFTAAEGISPTLYLKEFRHISPRYCGDAEGYYATYIDGNVNFHGYGVNGSYLQAGGYPGLLPSTIPVTLL